MAQPKTLIIFMDGTWQDDDQDVPTNIHKLYKSTKAEHFGRTQVRHYIDGVGASGSWFKKKFGGAFGSGLSNKIIEAYMFLADQFQPGDRIVLVGYSRGAYSVRSLAGMINKVGLVSWTKCAKRKGISEAKLRNQSKYRKELGRRAFRLYKDDKETVKFLKDNSVSVPKSFSPSSSYAKALRKEFSHCDASGNVTTLIDALCCFETVGSRGIPEWALGRIARKYNERYEFHDYTLGKIIRTAYHAAAIDEKRANFVLTPMEVDTDHSMTNLQQRWFPGAHGIGGGNNVHYKGDGSKIPDNGLAEIAGLWMGECMRAEGVGLKTSWANNFEPDPADQPNHKFYDNLDQGDPVPRGIPALDSIDMSVWKRKSELSDYNPPNLKGRGS